MKRSTWKISNSFWKRKTLKKTRDRYQNLSEEEKEKTCQYRGDPNENLSEEGKEKKVG